LIIPVIFGALVVGMIVNSFSLNR